VGSQAVETADMGTQFGFARKPIQAQTGLSTITMDGAEMIAPVIKGPTASEPSAPSRSPMPPSREPMPFPRTEYHDMAVGDNLSADETDRDTLRRRVKDTTFQFKIADLGRQHMEEQLENMERRMKEQSRMQWEDTDRFGKRWGAPEVEKPLERLEDAEEEGPPVKEPPGNDDGETNYELVESEVEDAKEEIDSQLKVYIEDAKKASGTALEAFKQVVDSGTSLSLRAGKKVVEITPAIANFLIANPAVVVGAILGYWHGHFLPKPLTTQGYEWLWNSMYSAVGWGPAFPALSQWQMAMIEAQRALTGGVLAGTGAYIYKSIANAFGKPMRAIAGIPSAPKLQAMLKLGYKMKEFELDSGDISEGEKLLVEYSKLKGKKAKKKKALPPPNVSSESETQSQPLRKMTLEEVQALRREILARQQVAKPKAATTKPTKGQQHLEMRTSPGWLFNAPMQTLQQQQQQKQKQQSKKGAGKPKGKTLIHVPPPIMEYFDVKNDHYMMKQN